MDRDGVTAIGQWLSKTNGLKKLVTSCEVSESDSLIRSLEVCGNIFFCDIFEWFCDLFLLKSEQFLPFKEIFFSFNVILFRVLLLFFHFVWVMKKNSQSKTFKEFVKLFNETDLFITSGFLFLLFFPLSSLLFSSLLSSLSLSLS